MLDVAAGIGFPGYLDAASEIARRIIDPAHPEIAGDLGMDRYLRVAQRGVDAAAERHRLTDADLPRHELHQQVEHLPGRPHGGVKHAPLPEILQNEIADREVEL